MLWGQTGAFSVLSNKERALLWQGCLWSSEGSCGRTRKWRLKTGKICPVQTAILVLYFGETFSLCDVFAPCGYLYDISFPNSSIPFCVLFLHSNNGFPCVCRLSSSSSFHYKQITSCLLQPEMRKCVTICVPEDFFPRRVLGTVNVKAFFLLEMTWSSDKLCNSNQWCKDTNV